MVDDAAELDVILRMDGENFNFENLSPKHANHSDMTLLRQAARLLSNMEIERISLEEKLRQVAAQAALDISELQYRNQELEKQLLNATATTKGTSTIAKQSEASAMDDQTAASLTPVTDSSRTLTIDTESPSIHSLHTLERLTAEVEARNRDIAQLQRETSTQSALISGLQSQLLSLELQARDRKERSAMLCDNARRQGVVWHTNNATRGDSDDGIYGLVETLLRERSSLVITTSANTAAAVTNPNPTNHHSNSSRSDSIMSPYPTNPSSTTTAMRVTSPPTPTTTPRPPAQDNADLIAYKDDASYLLSQLILCRVDYASVYHELLLTQLQLRHLIQHQQHQHTSSHSSSHSSNTAQPSHSDGGDSSGTAQGKGRKTSRSHRSATMPTTTSTNNTNNNSTPTMTAVGPPQPQSLVVSDTPPRKKASSNIEHLSGFRG